MPDPETYSLAANLVSTEPISLNFFLLILIGATTKMKEGQDSQGHKKTEKENIKKMLEVWAG